MKKRKMMLMQLKHKGMAGVLRNNIEDDVPLKGGDFNTHVPSSMQLIIISDFPCHGIWTM
jgi:hypothetical protein